MGSMKKERDALLIRISEMKSEVKSPKKSIGSSKKLGVDEKKFLSKTQDVRSQKKVPS